MPKPKHHGGGKHRKGGAPRTNSYNPAKAPGKKANNRFTQQRKDTTIRPQSYDVFLVLHCEHAKPDPMQLVELAEARNAMTTAECVERDEATNAPTTATALTNLVEGQVVDMAVALVHAESGEVLDTFHSYVRPTPAALPYVNNYTRDLFDIARVPTAASAADPLASAPVMADVLGALHLWVAELVPEGTTGILAACGQGSILRLFHGEQQYMPAETECGMGRGSWRRIIAASRLVRRTPEAPASSSSETESDAESDSGSTEEEGEEKEQVKGGASAAPAPARTATTPVAGTAVKISAFDRLPEYFTNFVDVRECFHRFFKVRDGVSLRLHDMLKEMHIPYAGRAHCASHAAKNLARLMQSMLRKGYIFSYPRNCRAAQHQKGYGSRVALAIHHGDTPATDDAAISTTGDLRQLTAQAATDRPDSQLEESRPGGAGSRADGFYERQQVRQEALRRQEQSEASRNANTTRLATASGVTVTAMGPKQSPFAALAANVGSVMARWVLFVCLMAWLTRNASRLSPL